jgi:O-antigen ligase
MQREPGSAQGPTHQAAASLTPGHAAAPTSRHAAAPAPGAAQAFALLAERVAFVLLIATLPFAPAAQGSTYPWSLLGLRLLVASTLALAVLGGLARGWRAPPAPLSLALGAYLLLVVLSTLASPYTYGSWRETQLLTTYALGFLLAAHLVTGPRRTAVFVTAALLSAAMLAGYGLLQATGLSLTPGMSTRVSSTYYNPNHYAGYLDLTTPLALAFALWARTWWLRAIAALLSVALLLNVALSFSRGAWVALALAVAGLLLLWAWQGTRSPRPLGRTLALLTLALVALVGAWGVSVTAPDLTARLLTRAQRLHHDLTQPDTFDRVVLLRAGAQVVRDAPLLGVGPGNFVDAITAHRPAQVDDRADSMMHRFVNYAHNDYLQVATETGLPSLLLFMAFWALVLIRPSPRDPPLRYGLLAGLAALLVHGLVDGNLTVIPANAWLGYTLAGVLHARGRRPHS